MPGPGFAARAASFPLMAPSGVVPPAAPGQVGPPATRQGRLAVASRRYPMAPAGCPAPRRRARLPARPTLRPGVTRWHLRVVPRHVGLLGFPLGRDFCFLSGFPLPCELG